LRIANRESEETEQNLELRIADCESEETEQNLESRIANRESEEREQIRDFFQSCSLRFAIRDSRFEIRDDVPS